MSSLGTELEVYVEFCSKDDKLILKKQPTQKLKQTKFILEHFEYFTKCHQNRSLQFLLLTRYVPNVVKEEL